MHRSGSRTFQHSGEHENPGGWVRAEERVGRGRTLGVWHVVAQKTHSAIIPNRWQFVFSFDKDLVHVRNVVKVECHLRIESFDSKQEVRIREDNVLFLEPLSNCQS